MKSGKRMYPRPLKSIFYEYFKVYFSVVSVSFATIKIKGDTICLKVFQWNWLAEH